MKLWGKYIVQYKMQMLIYALFCAIFLAVFGLYHLPLGAVLYPALLCAILGMAFMGMDYRKVYQRHLRLLEIQDAITDLLEQFPEPESIEVEDYQRLVELLWEQQLQGKESMNARYNDMIDYYTLWVHQIKTPIASMRLHLQKEDTELTRKLSEDLFRIEQYVEMVLVFLRLDAGTTDYVIGEYDLDAIVKSAVKKFAGQFIRRKIKLEYEPLKLPVLTDEKWFSFVIEQLLSNALKYTNEGSITIFLEGTGTLCIQDTGIGIAPEDLPRIFEKGYTGYNGRMDKKASGIGLYLCRRICRNLGHNITASSVLDRGTTIRIDLEKKRLEIE